MSRDALQTLQDVHERIRPALFIAEWQEKHMDVVGHDYGCIEMNSRTPAFRGRGRPRHTSFAQAMLENKITGYLWQNPPSACTEGDKDSRIRLLQVWKPPTITVFGQRRSFGGHGTRGAGAPARHLRVQGELLRVSCQCRMNMLDKSV